jgi:membrane protein YdbS with pleckstrin-like domain
LFVIRLRERAGWIRRGVLMLVVAVVMFLGMYFAGRQVGMGQMVLISLAAGAVIVILFDVGNIQRDVTIFEDSIVVGSTVGHGWFKTFKFPDVQQVNLMRPEDWNRPFGAMLIQTADDGFLVGVPRKISVDTAADVLHRLKVAVTLNGWTPSETDTRVQVKDEVALPAAEGKVSGTARIWPVDENEGKLNPPAAMAVAIVMALGPLLLSLIGLIGAVIYVIMKWGVLETMQKVAIGGGALIALVVSIVYLALAGQFLASRYLIGVAKKVLRTRPSALFTGDEDELIPVEIYDRTAWTTTVAKSSEFGFLRIDGPTRSLRFEGNKNRWEIPIGALTAGRIEEAHVGSEGNPDAEKRYYVVISCDHAGEPWEAGMTQTRIELGNDGKDARYARAQGLMRAISERVG